MIELIITNIGVSVSQFLLKEWLEDDKLTGEIGASVIGSISSNLGSLSSRKSAEREFDSIGDAISQKLVVLFESDTFDLTPGAKEYVIRAVTYVMKKAAEDEHLILSSDLSPEKLMTTLEEQYPISNLYDFYGDQDTLFKIVIKELCFVLVRIYASLPEFNKDIFSKIFENQNEISTSIGAILEQLEEIRSEADLSIRGDLSRFEERYRKLITVEYAKQKLYGVRLTNADHDKYDLNLSYIALDLHSENNESSSINEGSDLSIILKEKNNVLIKGLAGYGKTTLLNWIATKCAENKPNGELDFLYGVFPFFIRLRHVKDAVLPSPEEFVKYTNPNIAEITPAGWVNSKLSKGEAIVLIDGIDEISKKRRREVRDWVSNLIETFPRSRFVVTSRPSAVTKGWLDRDGFQETEIKPMDKRQIAKFVSHWHKSISSGLTDKEELASIPKEREAMLLQIENSRQLSELAESPLLCAMMCALNREKNKKLPQDKIELYDDFIKMLLDRRDNERNILDDRDDIFKLNYRQKLNVICEIAHWMMINEIAEASFSDIDQQIGFYCSSIPELKNASQQEFRQFLLERSGVIREPIEKHIDFVHKTFQEYLAANHIVNKNNINMLIKNATKDFWQETIILTAAIAPEDKFEEIFNELSDRSDNEVTHSHSLGLLAISCISDRASPVSKEVQSRAKSLLEKIIPPKNITEAKAIAKAGELAIPFLSGQDCRKNANKAAPTVRALSLLYSHGHESAGKLLEKFASDTRKTVVSELVKSASVVNSDYYEEKIFPYIAKQVTHNNRDNSCLSEFLHAVPEDNTFISLFISHHLLRTISKTIDFSLFKKLTSLHIGVNCDFLMNHFIGRPEHRLYQLSIHGPKDIDLSFFENWVFEKLSIGVISSFSTELEFPSVESIQVLLRRLNNDCHDIDLTSFPNCPTVHVSSPMFFLDRDIDGVDLRLKLPRSTKRLVLSHMLMGNSITVDGYLSEVVFRRCEINDIEQIENIPGFSKAQFINCNIHENLMDEIKNKYPSVRINNMNAS